MRLLRDAPDSGRPRIWRSSASHPGRSRGSGAERLSRRLRHPAVRSGDRPSLPTGPVALRRSRRDRRYRPRFGRSFRTGAMTVSVNSGDSTVGSHGGGRPDHRGPSRPAPRPRANRRILGVASAAQLCTPRRRRIAWSIGAPARAAGTPRVSKTAQRQRPARLSSAG